MNEIKIDCHSHDKRSDGLDNIEDFAYRAVEMGLDMCAITNHDIIDRSLKKILKNTNIVVPEAVEISVQNYDLEKSLHLTSYSDNFKHEIDDVLENTLYGKAKMLEEQCDKLSDMGFILSFKEILEYSALKGKKTDSLNKFSISEFIYNGKYSELNKKFIKKLFKEEKDIVWLFLNLLKKGGKFYEEYSVKTTDYEPSVKKIGELTKNSNAILSIAHPNFTFKKGVGEFESEVGYYVERGVNAVEINTVADKKWVESILKVKKQYNLILTFGSDCHKIGEIDDKHYDFGIMNPIVPDDIVIENFHKFKEKIF